ncbi:dephospho-CoA kinase [Lutispora thermophila]|uniref:Dephospho-CoA kinase n=1 Tax=Lutispora thermophila DSM 19022 TaxID=1122184 RepID=A0A1M6FQV4_9FIRM|nr:dephospho-CoA kinase [Lutispora thermophila]SHJ00035.1 dephospho-CoA kinase [Lutispora thermophila DSM 19022]
MVIGLTGGIASGKSTVSSLLKKLGAYIIDVDEIGRDVVEKGEKAYNEIVDYFGKDILLPDGQINRKALGHIVFSDRDKLNKLNSITHPHIIDRVKDIISECKSKGIEIMVVDAAILIEMGLHSICDIVWLVKVDKNIQLHRLMERDHYSYEEANNRIMAQYSDEKKAQFADVIIDNKGTFEELEEEVKKQWTKIVSECQKGRNC